MSMQGKTVLVTGANSGMGLATTVEMARREQLSLWPAAALSGGRGSCRSGAAERLQPDPADAVRSRFLR